MVKKETKIRAVQLEAVIKRHRIVIILVPAVLLRIRQGGNRHNRVGVGATLSEVYGGMHGERAFRGELMHILL